MRDIAVLIMDKIEALQQEKQSLLIAVDGRCAAGKTTFAAYLQEALSCNVIHMYHFFPRPEQQSPERMNEPGGNVDHERLISEVLVPLRQGGDFSYRLFDCQRQDFGEAVFLKANEVNIVEGSYSCHPALWDYYDLRIFLTIDSEKQLQRIRKRNGFVHSSDFINKWIPLEERYFAAFNVEERCDYCFHNISL